MKRTKNSDEKILPAVALESNAQFLMRMGIEYRKIINSMNRTTVHLDRGDFCRLLDMADDGY